MKVHPFIEAEKAAGHNVAKACVLLEVSKSAYYERAKAIPSQREVTDAELLEQIVAIHKESKGTYGSPRVHKALRKQGVECGKRRVRRLMRLAGLEGRCKRRWRALPSPGISSSRGTFFRSPRNRVACWCVPVTPKRAAILRSLQG